MKAAQNRESDDYKHLESINGIGPIVAEKILSFFASPKNIAILKDIISKIEVTDFMRHKQPLQNWLVKQLYSLEHLRQ